MFIDRREAVCFLQGLGYARPLFDPSFAYDEDCNLLFAGEEGQIFWPGALLGSVVFRHRRALRDEGGEAQCGPLRSVLLLIARRDVVSTKIRLNRLTRGKDASLHMQGQDVRGSVCLDTRPLMMQVQVLVQAPLKAAGFADINHVPVPVRSAFHEHVDAGTREVRRPDRVDLELVTSAGCTDGRHHRRGRCWSKAVRWGFLKVGGHLVTSNVERQA